MSLWNSLELNESHHVCLSVPSIPQQSGPDRTDEWLKVAGGALLLLAFLAMPKGCFQTVQWFVAAKMCASVYICTCKHTDVLEAHVEFVVVF